MRQDTLRKFKELALAEAQKAFEEGEVPVGAVLLASNGTLLSAAHNSSEADDSSSAHAEFKCLKEAETLFGRRGLLGTTLIVTLEPCLMCLGALLNAGVKNLWFLALNPREGAFSRHGIDYALLETHFVEDARSSTLMTAFFSSVRAQKNVEKTAEKGHYIE